MFEKSLGLGALDLEGAYYAYGGEFKPLKYSYLALASYVFSTVVGIGKIQPLVRLQQAKVNNPTDDTWTSFEGQIGYVVDDFGAKLALGYQRTDLGATNGTGNALYLGVQLKQ